MDSHCPHCPPGSDIHMGLDGSQMIASTTKRYRNQSLERLRFGNKPKYITSHLRDDTEKPKHPANCQKKMQINAHFNPLQLCEYQELGSSRRTAGGSNFSVQCKRRRCHKMATTPLSRIYVMINSLNLFPLPFVAFFQLFHLCQGQKQLFFHSFFSN